MTTKHNPVTLPINLYAVGPPDVQPRDLTKLGGESTKDGPRVHGPGPSKYGPGPWIPYFYYP